MKKFLHINQDYLKIFALITMTLDHMGKILFVPVFLPMTLTGRTAFPVFSYLIMLHLYKKQCFRKYFVRLFLFGLLTSILLVIQNVPPNNILWSFFIAVSCIWLFEKATFYSKDENVRLFLQILIFFFCFGVSIGADYSIFGFCYLLSLYGFFKHKSLFFIILSLIFGGLINPTSLVGASISILTTVILLLNHTQANDKRYIHSKWFFYIYYPAHLTILYVLKSWGVVF